MKVIYSSTRDYYKYLKWSMASLLEHNEVEKIYLLAEDDRVLLDISCPYEVVNYSHQKYYGSSCPNIRSPWSVIPLVYTLIPELVPEDKAMYLDMDTVICESLQPIWDLDLAGKWGAWCPERMGTYQPFGTKKYYNGGVAIFNLAQMREDHITEQLVDLLNRKYFPCSGQDALNLILSDDKVIDLDTRYNECFCCGYTSNPAIVHYAGIWDWMSNPDTPRWNYLAKYQSNAL